AAAAEMRSGASLYDGMGTGNARRAIGGCEPPRRARDLRAMLAKIMPEPEGEGARLFPDPPVDVVTGEERDLGHLGRVGPRLGCEPAEIDVDEFILAHAVAEVGLVAREEAERERAGEPELLLEPAAGGRQRPLAGTRMAATGIRPQAARVIFFR